MKKRMFVVAISMLGTVAVSHDVFAQSYPNKPIHLIVPFPAASSTDIVARVVGQKLGERLGQAVIIENKPGAGGNIASQAVAAAPADGYTLLVGTVANAVSATFYSNLGYDFVKDLAPITLMTTAPLIIVANLAQPFSNAKEMIAYAKQKPNAMHFGSGGNGTANHLAGEMLNQSAGIHMVHVPYRGGSAAVTDLLGGQIEIVIDSLVGSISHVKAGRLKAIAVTSVKRVESLPNVPTVAESGLPVFDAVGWHGLNAPAGTPNEIVDRLNREVVAVLRLPEVKAKLGSFGAVVAGTTPEQYASFIRSEIAKWGDAVKKSGARAN
jgi:tripartite-type tricarboxylate transporter receptor subunit TctC